MKKINTTYSSAWKMFLGTVCMSFLVVGGLFAQGSAVATETPGLTIDDANDPSVDFMISGIPGASPIESVTLSLGITHTFYSDLEVTLTDPLGNTYDVTSDNKGSTNCSGAFPLLFDEASPNPITTFDVCASDDVLCENCEFCDYSPEQAFSSQFPADGADYNGPWNLTVVDDAGGDNGTLDNFELTINYGAQPAGCEIQCPADIIVNLGPGECNAPVSYAIGAVGECATTIAPLFENFEGPFDPANWSFTDNGTGGSVDVSGAPASITISSGSVTGGSSILSIAVPASGVIAFDWDYSTGDTGGPPWEDFGYSLNGVTTFLVGSGAGAASGSTTVEVNAGDVFGFVAFNFDGFAPNSSTVITNFLLGQEVFDFTITGPESGDILDPGTYTVDASIPDLVTGDDVTCSFDITVVEYTGATLTSLACNDLVQVSVDENCEANVGADEILEGGPYMCYDDFIVEIEGIAGNVNGVSTVLPTGTHTVTVTNPNNNNSCWGEILVEDKLPPVLECLDTELICGESTDPVFSAPVTGSLTATATPGSAIGPDAGTVTTSVLNVSTAPDGARITDLNIYLDITHSFVGDLTIIVTSPSGTDLQLWGNNCGNQPTGFDITFDDESANTFFTLLCVDLDQGLDVDPSFFQPLANADGDALNGGWTITITDAFNLDGGTLNSWSIIAEYETVAAYAPIVTDNCDSNPELTYTDATTGDECTQLVISRTWTATDDSGNSATCVQTITVDPVDVSGVEFPANYEGECGESTDPSNTGYPTINGTNLTPDGGVCNIFVDYWDKPLNDCGNGSKIVRTWTVLDWCTQEVVEGAQIIKLADNEGPVLTCPADFSVGTDFWYCYANVSVPKPAAFDVCGADFTLELTSSAGLVVSFGNNYVINELPIGTHTVTWTATDACDNESSCSFEITVQDDVPPVPNCDEHTIVSLTNDGPGGLTLVPAIVFDDNSYDNCSDVTFRARRMASCIDFDWTTNGACIDDAPNGFVNSRDRGTVLRDCVPFACCDVAAGPIMVELEVTDAAGNVNFCMVEVNVQDKLAPFLVCPPDVVVSCDFWFDSEVTQNQFIPFSEDPMQSVFGTVIDAYDVNDNEGARKPVIINDPGNNNLPQPYNWGLDGWADDNCNVELDVRIRILDDCSGDDLPSGAPADAVRYIERTFRAQDDQGNTTTCRQVIWIVDYDRFDVSDITWPRDIPSSGCSLDDCPEGDLSPDNLSAMGLATRCVRPQVADDNCSLIGITYDDTRFDFVDGACYKILREWTIIDWCQYDANTGAGIWKHTQVIKVIDTNGPTFEDCPAGPVTLCVLDEGVSLPANNQVFLGESNPLASSCSVHVQGSHTVTETCSDYVIYDVKVYPFDGAGFVQLVNKTQVSTDETGSATLTFNTETAPLLAIRQNGLPYNSPFCGDYHRVLWSVEDGCGNISTCEYLVRLEDCKQPSPVCINGLSTVVMPSDGTVTIWAKEYNASSIDDCTPSGQLLYSFSGDSYTPSMEYNCDNVPAFGAELSVQIWVADGGVDHNCNNQITWNERNKDFCTTTIVITDNDGSGCGGSGSLGGEVMTHAELQGVANTELLLTVPGEVFQKYAMTDDEGQYSFAAPLGQAYEVDATRNDDHKNGVSTLDLVRIQKHLLGVEPFSSPYDMIAADANNSESVSGIDLVELRKLILGIYTELPNNESWRFVDATYEFANPANPWPFKESVDVATLSDADMDNHFEAVKVGDVNNTVVANANQVVIRNANGVVNFVTEERDVQAGETVEVTFSADEFITLVGYQFTMNAKGLEFNGVKAAATEIAGENIGLVDGQITASWHNVEGVQVDAGQELFTFEFVAQTSGKLSQMLTINSTITEAEAYDKSEEIMDLGITFRGAADADFALYQNEPNPFNGVTVVGFDLPQAGAATLSVFDVTGKVVKVIEGDYAKGFNRVEISSKDLSAAGVMYYRLDAGEYTATKKMVIIK